MTGIYTAEGESVRRAWYMEEYTCSVGKVACFITPNQQWSMNILSVRR